MHRCLPILFYVAVCLLVAPAGAQQANDIGIFLETTGTQPSGGVAPFETFSLYVVGFGLAEVGGAEMRIDAPPELIITGFVLNGAPPCSACQLPDLAYGTTCLPGAPALQLVELRCLLLPADDVTICLGPTTVSSFTPPSPGYVLCDQTTLVPFTHAVNGGDDYPDGCAVLNPTSEPPVSAADLSWGAAKARYQMP